jgi:hypothetical protein
MIKANQYNLKTAVILTGAPRTWHFCKEYIVKFIQDVFEDADWFVCIHESKTTSCDEIYSFLKSKNQNIIYNAQILNSTIPDYNSAHWDRSRWTNSYFKGLMYLNYLAGFQKRIHEFKTGVRYHRVFFARPDCIYLYNSSTKEIENSFSDYKNFSFQMRGDYDELRYNYASPSANHLRLIGGLFSSDVFCNWNLEFDFKKDKLNQMLLRLGTDMHSGLSLYFRKHLITVDDRWFHNENKMGFLADVVRPTSLVYNKSNYLNFVSNFDSFDLKEPWDHWPGECHYFSHNDMETAWKYRIKSCWELNIDTKDYLFDPVWAERYREAE